MKAVGIELEWPPRRVAYQVAMAGLPIGWERMITEEARERYKGFRRATGENMEMRFGV
jgi:hypothetical protein